MKKIYFYVSLCHFYVLWAIWSFNIIFKSYEYGHFGGIRGFFDISKTLAEKQIEFVRFFFVHPLYFYFLYERAPRFYDYHVIKFFWQILKHFLDFETKKNFSYTWEHSGARNKNVNKFLLVSDVPIRDL